MPRYKLTIAYDGTDFCGWQKQEPPADTDVRPGLVLTGAASAPAADSPAGDGPRIILRSVQEVVERAVRSVVGEPVIVMGASRTDAGVHARGQVAAFTCGDNGPDAREAGWPISRGVDRLAAAINARLPEDVVVLAAEAVEPGFDPIGDCTAKGYAYTLHVGPTRPLFDRRYAHHVRTPIDADAMRRAAELIVGEHDFAAFARAGHGRESTVRTVFECRVVEEGTEGQRDERTENRTGAAAGPSMDDRAEAEADAPARRLRIEVSGSGFLHNMVRIIAGTLVEAGRGRLTPDDVADALRTGDRRRAGPTLPPHGLCLEWVRYAHAKSCGSSTSQPG